MGDEADKGSNGVIKPRIAICGFSLESHRWAKSCSRKDFEDYAWWTGDSITKDARAEFPSISRGVVGFYNAMDKEYGVSGWQDMPISIISTCPAGPVEEIFFKEHLVEVAQGLRDALPLDGVYICQHGGSIATHTDDSDGDYFEVVRNVVGADVPVISTLDLHSNISDKMTSCVDAMIGYLTYPHIDGYDRGQEAGHAMKEMVTDGMRTAKAHIRLPLVAPLVTQFTFDVAGPVVPYGDLIRLGQTKIDDDVLNITILSGFDFCDSVKNGMTILVYTRGRHTQNKADRLCRELAIAGWNDRYKYADRLKEFVSLEVATERAKAVGDDLSLPSLLFADIADNPGGGARSNTTFILESFINAGVHDCILGLFYDPLAVKKCKDAGVGAEIELSLNEEEYDTQSHKLKIKGIVKALSDGNFIGKYGMTKGQTRTVGESAALLVGGVTVVINAKRTQCLSADQFAFIGLDPASARSIVVKSTVHYRAGFEHIFSPERILEVNAPGLTTCDHTILDWKYLPRPCFPLDGEKAKWTPPVID